MPPIRVTAPCSSRMGKLVSRSQRIEPSAGRTMRYSKCATSPALTLSSARPTWSRSSGWTVPIHSASATGACSEGTPQMRSKAALRYVMSPTAGSAIHIRLLL